MGATRPDRARRVGPWLAVLAGVGLGGCTWDDVTSRQYRHDLWDHPYETLFVARDPVQVLKESQDGRERAKALRALREPSRHGGSEAQQAEALQLLTAAATGERQPLCRLAAIETLGEYRDPRAAEALVAAYHALAPRSTGIDPTNLVAVRQSHPELLTYLPDTINLVQCQTLTALGKTAQPQAVVLLAQVAETAVPADDKGDPDLPRQTRNLRLAAVRALGNAQDPRGTAALARVLIAEQHGDVALRDRAHETLVQVTGQHLPPDADAWRTYLDQPSPAAPVGGTPVRTVSQP